MGHKVYEGYAILAAIYGVAIVIVGSILTFSTDYAHCDSTLWIMALTSLIMVYVLLAMALGVLAVTCCVMWAIGTVIFHRTDV
jgi:hypothetical protein